MSTYRAWFNVSALTLISLLMVARCIPSLFASRLLTRSIVFVGRSGEPMTETITALTCPSLAVLSIMKLPILPAGACSRTPPGLSFVTISLTLPTMPGAGMSIASA